LMDSDNEELQARIKNEVKEMMSAYPLFQY